MIQEILFVPAGLPERFPRAALIEWLVAEGQLVDVGTVLCRFEIDKAIVEFEANTAGYMRRLLVNPGDRLARGDRLALISQSVDEPLPEMPHSCSVLYTGFDWSEIDNVAGDLVPLDVMRKTIAERMAMSKRHIPSFYLTVAVDMSSCIARRHSMRKTGRKATYNDMAIKAAALALGKHPKVASVYMPGGVAARTEYNIGFAAALPDDGLVVPVIKRADTKELIEIATETRDLTAKAKAGNLVPEDCSGGVFSVSYLGGYEVDNFVAIVNPGEAAIAALGKTMDTPVAVDGRVEIRPIAKITMSSDHRSIDGALAARFMTEMKWFMEHATEL